MISATRKNQLYQDHKVFAWLMLAFGASFYAYEFVIRLAPALATKTLLLSFNINAGELGKVLAFYYFIYTPLQLVVGILMDRYGPQILLTLSCLLCVLGNVLFSMTHNTMMAEFSRVLMGGGAAFAYVGALKLATLWLPKRHFGLATGVINTVGMMMGALSEDILSPMIQHIGWMPTMHIVSAAGVVLCASIWFFVRDGYEHISENPPELMHFRPLFAGLKSALQKPAMWMTGFIGFSLFASVSVISVLWGPLYLEQAKHLTSIEAAWVNSLILWGFAVGALIVGKLSDVLYSRIIVLRIASILACVVLASILYLPIVSLLWLSVLFFVLGLVSSGQIMVFTHAIEINPLKISGIAVSLMNLFVMLNAAVLQPLVGALIDDINPPLLTAKHVYLGHSLMMALSILPVLFALSFIVSLFLKEDSAH